MRDPQQGPKAREKALHQSNKLETIGQLTGGFAHDSNNLLTIIGSAVDFLRRDDLPKQPRDRYLAAISDTVTRTSKLTGQLLAPARCQALQPEPFDVGRHVRIVINVLGPLLGERIGIDCEQCDAACFAHARHQPVRDGAGQPFRRRARRHERRGTPDVHSRAHIRHPEMRARAAVSGNFAISVTDTGAGMAPKRIDQIFEPFFTTKKVGKGTGRLLRRDHAGHERSRARRSDPPRIDSPLPIILTSGYTNVLAEEATHGFGLVHKPYSVENLSRVIGNAIGSAIPHE